MIITNGRWSQSASILNLISILALGGCYTSKADYQLRLFRSPHHRHQGRAPFNTYPSTTSDIDTPIPPHPISKHPRRSPTIIEPTKPQIISTNPFRLIQQRTPPTLPPTTMPRSFPADLNRPLTTSVAERNPDEEGHEAFVPPSRECIPTHWGPAWETLLTNVRAT